MAFEDTIGNVVFCVNYKSLTAIFRKTVNPGEIQLCNSEYPLCVLQINCNGAAFTGSGIGTITRHGEERFTEGHIGYVMLSIDMSDPAWASTKD